MDSKVRTASDLQKDRGHKDGSALLDPNDQTKLPDPKTIEVTKTSGLKRSMQRMFTVTRHEVFS